MAIKQAVILAAGRGARLSNVVSKMPKGFIILRGKTLVELSIENLLAVGVKEILIVTGFLDHFYEELKGKYSCITTVKNKDFEKSGTMYSLFCARNLISSDFLLLESDLVYEKKALVEALEFSSDNCIVLSKTTNAGDEVYVEGNHGLISKISKNSKSLKNIVGEFIGISKISLSLFEKMLLASKHRFESTLQVDYDMDCLSEMSKETNIFYLKVKNLLWAEIDDGPQLLRAHKIRDHIISKQSISVENSSQLNEIN